VHNCINELPLACKRNGMRGARWCDLIGPRILGAVQSPLRPFPMQSVPGDRPDTSVAANQIAPSCTAHPVSFSRLGQFIYAVMPPCQLGRVAWSAIVYGYLFPHLYVLRHFLDDFRSSRFIWHSFRFTV